MDIQMQNYIQLQRECRSELGLQNGEPLVPTRFILWLVDKVQKLQQTPCSSLRELLVQMLKEEQEAYAASMGDMIKSERHESYEYAIKDVLSLLDARQPVA